MTLVSELKGRFGVEPILRVLKIAAVADVLDAAVPTDASRRLLDVGTGTGLVVEALLGRFGAGRAGLAPSGISTRPDRGERGSYTCAMCGP